MIIKTSCHNPNSYEQISFILTKSPINAHLDHPCKARLLLCDLSMPIKVLIVLLLNTMCFSNLVWAERKFSYKYIALEGEVKYESREVETEASEAIRKIKTQPQYAYNGSRGGGGGGFLCLDEKTKKHKLFSIDFKLTENKYPQHNFGKSDCRFIIEQIKQKLGSTNPALAIGLADFMAAADKSNWQNAAQVNISQVLPTRLWVKQCDGQLDSMGCMPNIPDDQYEYLPSSCISKVQIAERIPWKNPRTVMTLVDVKAIEALERDPVQCSHFYVHEWLRDFIAQAKDIRDFTAYLHSQLFFESNPRTVLTYLPTTIGAGYDRAGHTDHHALRNYYNQNILVAWDNPYATAAGRPTNSSRLSYKTEFFHRRVPLLDLALERNYRLQKGAVSSYLEINSNGYNLITYEEVR